MDELAELRSEVAQLRADLAATQAALAKLVALVAAEAEARREAGADIIRRLGER